LEAEEDVEAVAADEVYRSKAEGLFKTDSEDG
jgi:hypothetical protein